MTSPTTWIFTSISPKYITTTIWADYYLNQSGMVQMPEEWKGGIDLSTFGRNAAAQEKGAFTEYGYIVESGDEWERQFEGARSAGRIPHYELPAAGARRTGQSLYGRSRNAASRRTGRRAAAAPPRRPIILTSEKPAEKVRRSPRVWNRAYRRFLTATATKSF